MEADEGLMDCGLLISDCGLKYAEALRLLIRNSQSEIRNRQAGLSLGISSNSFESGNSPVLPQSRQRFEGIIWLERA